MIYPDSTKQQSMWEKKKPHFNGSDYIPKLDQSRLTTQLDRIRDLMLDGSWRTLGEIEGKLGYGQASISANLRNLRKDRFGGYTVEKQRRKIAGLFEYRLS